MRITRPQMFMEMAVSASKRATCMRLNVGAILVAGRSPVAIGYNGPPSGEPHCSGNDCQGRFHCHLTTHAEINAITHLPYDTKGPLDLYCTDSPCSQCYDRIVQDGRIARIFFQTPYRITDHLENSLYDIPVYRVLPAGYVMDWNTKELVNVAT